MRKSSCTAHNICRGEGGCSSSPLEANIYSEPGVRPLRGYAFREEEVAAATHSSHLEPSERRNCEGEGPTQKEYKAEVISPGDEDSSTSFPHHHLSLTPGLCPSGGSRLHRGTDVFVRARVCACVCAAVIITPKRHKRLMLCHETTDAIV